MFADPSPKYIARSGFSKSDKSFPNDRRTAGEPAADESRSRYAASESDRSIPRGCPIHINRRRASRDPQTYPVQDSEAVTSTRPPLSWHRILSIQTLQRLRHPCGDE